MLVDWSAIIGAYQVHQDRNYSEVRMKLNVLFRRFNACHAEQPCLMGGEIVGFTGELA